MILVGIPLHTAVRNVRVNLFRGTNSLLADVVCLGLNTQLQGKTVPALTSIKLVHVDAFIVAIGDGRAEKYFLARIKVLLFAGVFVPSLDETADVPLADLDALLTMCIGSGPEQLASNEQVSEVLILGAVITHVPL